VVFVGEHLTDAALTLLLERLLQNLRPKREAPMPAPRRRFVLMNENGDVLREAEVERTPSRASSER
jgi:hypothetical protein